MWLIVTSKTVHPWDVIQPEERRRKSFFTVIDLHHLFHHRFMFMVSFLSFSSLSCSFVPSFASFPFLLPPLPPHHSPLLSCFRSLALELPRLLLLELGGRGLGAFGCWSCCCVHFCNMTVKAGRAEQIISLLCWSEFHYFRLQIFI